MTKSVWRAPLIALGFSVLAFAQAGAQPTKVGIINIQNAIVQTKDGQKAVAEIDAKFGPRRGEFEKRQQELAQSEDQYRKGANTMAEDARQKLMRDIDTKRKQLERDTQDAQAELEQDQGRILNELGQKMMAVIQKYGTDHGFAVILDVSAQTSSVLWASNQVDITTEIVQLYDKGAGAAPAAAAPPAAAKPAAPAKK